MISAALEKIRRAHDLDSLAYEVDYDSDYFNYTNRIFVRGLFCKTLTNSIVSFFPVLFKWSYKGKRFIMLLNPVVVCHKYKHGETQHELDLQAMIDELILKIRESIFLAGYSDSK